MSTLKPNLTFRVVRMLCNGGPTRYVAIAWNYDVGQLMATPPLETYTLARAALDILVTERGCFLRYFDGEYVLSHDGAQMETIDTPSVPREQEDDAAHSGDPYYADSIGAAGRW